jgi:hypothetical protein
MDEMGSLEGAGAVAGLDVANDFSARRSINP